MIRASTVLGSTTIVRIYDCVGALVHEESNSVKPDGTITWDGRRTGGARASSGVYFIRVQTGPDRLACKVVLLR